MAPIAPRYRGLKSEHPASTAAANPVLAIPDWTQAADTQPATPLDSAPVQTARSNEQLSGAREEATAGISLAEKKGLDDYARFLAEQCRTQLKPYLNRLVDQPSLRSWQAIRGVMPGIIISISIICVWWMLGRNSPPPPHREVVGDPQLREESFEPIGEVPLRIANRDEQAARDSGVERAAGSDDQLFDRVEIIQRSEDSGSQPSAEDARVPDTTPHHAAGPVQHEVYDLPRETEYEWQRPVQSDAIMPQRQMHAHTPAPGGRLDSMPNGSQGRRSTQTSSQTNTARSQPEVYSYERTDPANYKDPDYVVPPVARRASGPNH